MHGNIEHLILVASGKGGVGKSTVAVNLALALANAGFRTGLLDADIYGPSVPILLGGREKPSTSDGKKIIPLVRHGLQVMSMGYLVSPETPMVWRGPMLAGAVSQFLSDVDWGTLDYLILDLPPGTGDIQLTLAQKFKVTGAVLVTTPQSLALADVIRAKVMFDKVRVPVLGVVENMTHFVCDHCQTQHHLFASGGGASVAERLDLPLLAQIPLEPAIRVCGDAGQSMFEEMPHSITVQVMRGLAEALIAKVAEQKAVAKANQPKKRSSLTIVRS